MENTLSLLFSFTMLYMASSGRLRPYINMLVIQGVLLFLIFNELFDHINIINYCFLAFETIVIKAIVIPLFIWKIIKKSETYIDTQPSIPRFYSLIASTIILFFGFIFAIISKHHLPVDNPLPFGISMSTIIISLLFITLRKKILTAIIGYIMMENGIFLLSLSIENEMPMIVNMGVLLDLFIAVFILGFLVKRINRSFNGDSLDKLIELKDTENDN
ncbi:MAG TPA: hypothetical protein DD381_02775 [Lentisphaeria bacterium]|nr:MAG: hypothetical protein A2X47_03480 [Lentisphaerae bacterium GWF2_38_69]HBM15259.1 hypothetical protein [Lentisphaeria bacterium]